MSRTYLIGARDSQLSRIQAEAALKHLARETGDTFTLKLYSSPGDRDKTTDLRQTPGDFFTQDLDRALLSGDIDGAIHSAKDLPATLSEGIDSFWLPWREDPRDCIVGNTYNPKRIGVSSGRRDEYAAARFPKAERITLRGTIPERLAQLDAGKYDAIITAAAAMQRLKCTERIAELIPLQDLTPPPGQGVLAITFRAQDPKMRDLRNLYLKAVRFVGAGVGDAELCTIAGARELASADVVIYDALMDPSLLALGRSPHRQEIYVGKRSGQHSMTQAEITQLIGEHARRGERVVRLKGGDPGLFGRLTEETDALTEAGIPFVVWPGVSALNAATTPTGLLLTARGQSRGFKVETPRSEGTHTPDIYFMALGMAEEIAQRYTPDTPCAIVRNAGSAHASIEQLTVGELHNQSSQSAPGLLIVGECTRKRFHPEQAPLGARRIWITGSEGLAERARRAILDLGGKPILRALVTFEATATIKIRPSKGYTLLVCTSPTAATLFQQQLISPVFTIPKKIAVTGPATAAVLAPLHIDIVQPTRDFSAKGLLETLPADLSKERILRVRSDEAGSELADELKKRGAKVKDMAFYTTRPLTPEIPEHEAVFLASASAVHAWMALKPKTDVDILVMGLPTAEALATYGLKPTTIASQQTVPASILAYARHCQEQHV